MASKHLPTVDLSPCYISDTDEVVKQLHEAFRDFGGAYLANHGIPQEQVRKMKIQFNREVKLPWIFPGVLLTLIPEISRVNLTGMKVQNSKPAISQKTFSNADSGWLNILWFQFHWKVFEGWMCRHWFRRHAITRANNNQYNLIWRKVYFPNIFILLLSVYVRSKCIGIYSEVSCRRYINPGSGNGLAAAVLVSSAVFHKTRRIPRMNFHDVQFRWWKQHFWYYGIFCDRNEIASSNFGTC